MQFLIKESCDLLRDDTKKYMASGLHVTSSYTNLKATHESWLGGVHLKSYLLPPHNPI